MRIRAVMALLALGAFALTACGKAAGPAPQGSAGEYGSPAPQAGGAAPGQTAVPAPSGQVPAPSGAPGQLREVSVVLDWYPNAVHAFLYLAQENGYFEQEGLKVTFKMPAENPTDGIKLVGAGRETFALYYQPDVLVARTNEQIPIVAVGAVVRHPLNAVMARASKGLKSPRDLEGKTVGYPSIPLNLAIVRTMVRSAGGNPDKVTMKDIAWDLIPAVATDKVDAISGGYVNHERVLLEKQGIPLTVFRPTDFGVPDYYELVLITGEKTAREDRALVEAFWRAAARGFADMKKDPRHALDVLQKHQAKEFPLDREVEEKSIDILLPLMDPGDGRAFGVQDAATWRQVAEWMKGQGLLKGDVKPDAAFITLGG